MSERKLWTIATGGVDPFKKESRQAVEYISRLHGLVGVHMVEVCGTNICDVYVDEKYLGDKQ